MGAHCVSICADHAVILASTVGRFQLCLGLNVLLSEIEDEICSDVVLVGCQDACGIGRLVLSWPERLHIEISTRSDYLCDWTSMFHHTLDSTDIPQWQHATEYENHLFSSTSLPSFRFRGWTILLQDLFLFDCSNTLSILRNRHHLRLAALCLSLISSSRCRHSLPHNHNVPG